MLKHIKVLEFQGLAPSVFCGLYFADQGAQVTIVSRPEPPTFSMPIHRNIMNRNKKCITLSLKSKDDMLQLMDIIKQVDIIVDPYRPGILEKQGLGPKDLQKINPTVILLRVTGYGQQGEMSLKPGHDLNYIASSGILSVLNGNQSQVQFPANFMADFVSASLGIAGTLQALKLRETNRKGYIVDCSLSYGCWYLCNLVKDQVDNSSKVQLERKHVSYFELNKRRYIITAFQDGEKTAKPFQIKGMIEDMQKNGNDWIMIEKIEIAQIKTVKSIKESNLRNPFFGNFGKQLTNKIPKRDQDRAEILNLFNLRQAKL